MRPMTDLFDLSGTAALVTGGNGGIGRGIAVGLAQAGASVVIAARNEEKTADAVAEIEGFGGKVVGVACDVLKRADIDAAVEAARSNFGRLDIVVANAGIGRGGQPQDIAEEAWDLTVDTNLKAVFQTAQAAYPLLKEGGRGKVITIGSEYSLFGSPTVLPYSASKGGVIQLTKSLAVAWARDDIQVNAIIPGWVWTDMTAGIKNNQRNYDRIIDRTPAKRFADPEELAGTAIFLASHASDFVTGQSIPVDGGYSIA
jgi:2-deoxy-D-gluconate 3-dehydrogenase